MSVQWSLTVDCARPRELAAFWCLALGYVLAAPPEGFATWEEWQTHFKIPEDEWDDGAFIEDPDGFRPAVSFLKVPEPKVVKNRMHFDIHVGGGRQEPFEVRWPRVQAVVDKLVAAGGAVLRVDEPDGTPDHVTMADPEGNEFDVL
ncbi:VOC family protein [Micromonospora sp. NPDC005305]|uniref:VOC family protein n=1 Tax=Micromonospora sp. NPDC005305 TaxID=3156875 RepID=UPI00339F286F